MDQASSRIIRDRALSSASISERFERREKGSEPTEATADLERLTGTCLRLAGVGTRCRCAIGVIAFAHGVDARIHALADDGSHDHAHDHRDDAVDVHNCLTRVSMYPWFII